MINLEKAIDMAKYEIDGLCLVRIEYPQHRILPIFYKNEDSHEPDIKAELIGRINPQPAIIQRE